MAIGSTETESRIDGRLAVIRNDLAIGRLDDKELDILETLLDIFDGWVKIHREEDGGRA